MSRVIRILHITTHMGGGVGRAIDAMLCYDKKEAGFEQTLMLLEEPVDKRYTNHCKEKGISVIKVPSYENLAGLISKYDIVLISWWNHPLMQRFLVDFPNVPVRIIIWVHVNAATYPVLPYCFANLADQILLTTRFTLNNPTWTKMQRDEIDDKLNIVYGVEKFDFENIHGKQEYKRSDKFKIVYLGTMNYSKLSPMFPVICKKIVEIIPNAEFIMIGSKDRMTYESIEKCGLEKYVKWIGFIDNPEYTLFKYDAFGYPLNSFHFGATENSLLEAMAAGLPVVVLNQSTESTIVKNGETGLVGDDIDSYVDRMKELYDNPNLCKKLGQNARNHIKSEYDIYNNLKAFHNAVYKTMQNEKEVVNFITVMGKTPFEIFMNFCGEIQKRQFSELMVCSDDKKIREIVKSIPTIFKAKTKSSVAQFSSAFPDDTGLKKLSELLDIDQK